MSTPRPKHIIIELLEQKNIKIIGEFTSSRSSTLLECSVGHKWTAVIKNVLREGCGCPFCSGKQLTREIINSRLADRKIRLIGNFDTVGIKTEFICEYNHKWMAEPNNVMKGNSCPECSRLSKSLSSGDVFSRLLNRGISSSSEYTNKNSRGIFECLSGHSWESSFGNILSGRGCPICAYHGFNPSKPSWVYILKFDTYIKYGITNNLNQRINQHKRNGDCILSHSCYFENGSTAVDLEKNIKLNFGGRYVSKEQFPNGWTETLPLHLLESLINTVGNYTKV
jgi:hypothetical protein